jgi:8-amino-7-oxononanoate synthase
VLDFTSALYLGLQHPSHSLRPWQALTTGAPAALHELSCAREIARALAELQGCEAGLLAASTLHVAWDLFGLLAEKPITIHMDARAYPISRWGVQRAAMRGATVRLFRHHDTGALERDLAKAPRGRRTPVIVTDGICPGCGRVAPLGEYVALSRRWGGLVVVDDTQALGIFGHSPSARSPYGIGGGGALRWCGIDAPDALVFASLAKGFGAPLAVLAGSRARLREFEEKSLTRVHCSPPSIAALRAAEQAIRRNRRDGDILRARLLDSVRRFRRGVHRSTTFRSGAGLFPMQTIQPTGAMTAAEAHERLLARGIRTVLQRGERGRPRITFIITTQHSPEEIDLAVGALAEIATLQSPEGRTYHHEDLVANRA